MIVIATYVISDIHGEYDMFMDLLEKIDFKSSDTLYIIGDIIDRGPHPIKIIKKIMSMSNVICLIGNHELMALHSLKFLVQDITEENINDMNTKVLEEYLLWVKYNGGQTTIDEFRALPKEEQLEVIEYLMDFLVYEEIKVAGRDYLLVHAGLGGFYPGKNIEDYSIDELVWDRPNYDVKYFDDKFVVTGHTPTQIINGNTNPGFIYRRYNNIVIDCGAHYSGGRLAALCLDTDKEYYSYVNLD